MLSVGLDLHKRYSQLEVLDDTGMRRASARLPNELEADMGSGPEYMVRDICAVFAGRYAEKKYNNATLTPVPAYD